MFIFRGKAFASCSAVDTATNKEVYQRDSVVLIHGSPLHPSELELVEGNSGQEKEQVFCLIFAVFYEPVLFPRLVPV